ncbi:response regulator transcription factor [Baekduia soli]|uniref:Response regulator transcription factor n=1 Tax=Baekduia soli TaxID=496014 RepID=A0A5B8U086_9ACTN|nr:response regulator transcription factor [Baekduia soli]QEC46382.1 response regulator transcription factor [Baekduia soli]
MSRRILIVEDDTELRALIVRALRGAELAIDEASTGAQALRRVDEHRYDALVLDIGLPDTDGRDLCQALRAGGVEAPVLFLTARGAVVDRIAGFSAGGDDYLVKPFDIAELAARVAALLRRGSYPRDVGVGRLVLDPLTFAMNTGKEAVTLTPTEFRLLAFLASHVGVAVRRHELARAAWPYGGIIHDNTLDVHVSRIRRKLAPLPGAPVVDTVRGVGYILR